MEKCVLREEADEEHQERKGECQEKKEDKENSSQESPGVSQAKEEIARIMVGSLLLLQNKKTKTTLLSLKMNF